MFTVPTSTASMITANVSSLFADTGLLTIVALVAGIPLAFYIIKRLLSLVPKGR